MLNLSRNERLKLPGSSLQLTAAVLKIDTLQLMFRQGEMRSLESVSDMDSTAPDNNSVGWINYAQQRWPAYSLSSQLELQSSIPATRRACVLLALESGYFGVLCDDATLLKQMDGQAYELPVVMRQTDTPIKGIVSYNQNIACISDANSLAAHVRRQIQALSRIKET